MKQERDNESRGSHTVAPLLYNGNAMRTSRLVLNLIAIIVTYSLTGHIGPCYAKSAAFQVEASFSSRPLTPGSVLEWRANRPLTESEGELAFFIGPTDVSGLIVSVGLIHRYDPAPLALAVGESRVAVYLVTPTFEWRLIAEFPIKVLKPGQVPAHHVPAGIDTSTPLPASDDPPNSSRLEPGTRGWSAIPALMITSRSQPWVRLTHRGSERGHYSDLLLQGSLRLDANHRSVAVTSQFDVAGSSYQNDALRFDTLGTAAPRVDLASYSVKMKFGDGVLDAGHLSYTGGRHLIKDFVTRGLTLRAPLTEQVDFSIAAMNGSSIVGWGNFLGLDRREHQLISARLGFEMMKRPRALRVEVEGLDGSLLPLASYNQAQINDAEKSRSGGIRLLASDKGQRLQLDAGFARSLSTHPSDPLLAQGQQLTKGRPETRNARYLDLSYKVIDDLTVTESMKANVQVSLLHERVDPQFRSVGVDLQPNKSMNQGGVSASLGDVSAYYTYVRFEDNLDRIASLLTSRTERHAVVASLPLVSLLGDRRMTRSSIWVPVLAYSYDRTYQRGLSIPVDGGFKAPQIPNQLGQNHELLADWQSDRWRYSYRLSYSSQDNFGEKRTGTKVRHMVNGGTIAFAARTALQVSLDLQYERAINEDENGNKDARREDGTLRAAFGLSWRPTARMTITGNLANTALHSRGDLSLSGSNKNSQFDVQYSWRFLGQSAIEGESVSRPRFRPFATCFARYSRRSSRVRQELFGLNEFNRGETLTAGVSFTIF